MTQYRKKPIVIEAMQFTEKGEDMLPLLNFTEDKLRSILSLKPEGSKKFEITTLEGKFIINDGDYIIKGINGEFYPCKEEIFLKTYDKVED